MIVLHAVWSLREGLRIWGEEPGLRPASDRTRAHPFACRPDPLHEALGGEVPAPELCSLLLPSTENGPLASPQAAIDAHAPGDPPAHLARWVVPACALPPAMALELLLDLDSARGPGVRLGDSLTHLGEAAKLALELTTRGRFLPTLARREEGFVARWQPELSEPGDVERVRLLAESMPGATRAELPVTLHAPTDDPWDAELLPTAAVLVNDALSVLTDACVRQALGDRPRALSPRGRAWGIPAPALAWLASLSGPDPRVKCEADELSSLRDHLGDWAEATAPTFDGAVRLAFRLHDPLESEEAWRVDFVLEGIDDPSLVIPAERVWAARTRRRVDALQETLLSQLGQARWIVPEVQAALRTPRPTGFELDTDGAHRFLAEQAPRLQEAGFGLHLPAWWSPQESAMAARLVARPQEREGGGGSGLLGLAGLVDYEWQLALGGEVVSPEEFRALARLKAPLVRLRGRWVELRQGDVQAAMRLLERGDSRAVTTLEALRLAAGVQRAPGGLRVEGVRGAGWLSGLLEGELRPDPIETPPGLCGVLRPYQERGLGWLDFLDRVGLGGCLADDMGLGKTVQLLALLERERVSANGTRPQPTLLVCPMSVVGNWQREAARFVPELRVHVHHGAERLTGDAFREAIQGSHMVLTTYALAARDRRQLEAVEWARVVLDEAQNIKNPGAKQSQAVRALRARRRVALTGTPVENRLSELWSIMDFLNPGLLGSLRDFRESFANPIERYRDEESAARLRRLTGPFILRRLKTDRGIIQDLPEKLEMKVYCNLTREQATLYQAVVDDMMRRVEGSEGIERKGLILATMMKLKQVCNHPVHLLQDRSALKGRSGKLSLLEDVLEEALSVGDRTLIFTQFTEMGHMLEARLRERFETEVLFLHGATPRRSRDAMVARFQEDDGPPIFLLSLKAGGTGLNLTAANQVIHFDRWWNPAVEDQATDRAFRIGQTRSVQVRKLICVGTLEERIDAMIESKKELAGQIVGSGEGWLTELSTAELREIVRLSADTVAE